MSRTVKVGILGCGNVGGALTRLILDHGEAIETRTGIRIEVGAIAVRDLARVRNVGVAKELFTTDSESVVVDPSIDVVVEVMGGMEPARSLITSALGHGKAVVTANKELLAAEGADLFKAAEAAGVDLLFEASVCGGIPLMRPLRESLAGDRIRRVTGIVNGTTNYILTRMSEAGSSFEDALAEAQSLGYAEADPTADVEGFDAVAKAAIIASIAFSARVVASDVHREGIAGVTAQDIQSARDLGYVIKLLATAEEIDGEVSVRVNPAMIPADHPLAAVRGAFNAVFIEGDAVGQVMLYGPGAGGMPTASAVLGDVIDAAKNLAGGRGAAIGRLSQRRIRPLDEMKSQFYLLVEVMDKPGVLAAIAGVLGANGVSIKSMRQQGIGDEARLIFVTHQALESDFAATIKGVRELADVHRVGSILRVSGEEA